MDKFKISNNTLSELAYKKIKELIIVNVLKPGDKISQEKVANDLGISKIPLIQALTLLSKEGLIQKLPRKGFFVKNFSKKELDDIFAVRSVFEMLGVSSLIDELSAEAEEKLKEFISEFKHYYDQKKSREYYDLDVKFHYFLIESSKNKIIMNLNEEFNILLLCFTKGWVLDWDTSINQHDEIINSILIKEKDKAEHAIRNHIHTLKEEFNKKN
jgi:DNA-binding GntR family transcriptional regulator